MPAVLEQPSPRAAEHVEHRGGPRPSRRSPAGGTTSASTSASSPVEGTWCESHTMAPAVCIMKPSNDIHNCRPGWRTCWVQLPPAAHRSTHALAQNLRVAPRRRRFASNFMFRLPASARKSVVAPQAQKSYPFFGVRDYGATVFAKYLSELARVINQL